MLLSAVDGEPFPDMVTLRVRGEVEIVEMDELHESIVACADRLTPIVVLDMSEVEFMGSTALRALIVARADLEAQGYQLCIDECSSIVERVLQATALREHFPSSASVAAPYRLPGGGPRMGAVDCDETGAR